MKRNSPPPPPPPPLVAHFESFAPPGIEEQSEGWNTSLRNPRSILVANALEDVLPVLREAESASRLAWVAVAISYDAAPAFDRALAVHRDTEFPLVWCAIFHNAPPAASSVTPDAFAVSEFQPAVSSEEYLTAIAAIREYIAAGDTYQVNYTFPLRARFSGAPFSCFRTVARAQGARYSAYLDIGSHRVLSFSPELFFQRDGRRLTTRPMKGTAPRGRWNEEDEARAEMLRASGKDRAENVMIVDLLRNDLGRIAEPGSVQVPELFAVERLNRVLQMTSTITATEAAGTGLVDVLRALFPCGSITGAPKVRSTQIIRELEPHARGIYTGAIGLVRPGGDAIFNVAIRTLSIDARTNEATLGVGGGITWDSTGAGEYEESLLKAAFLTQRWPEFSLLETMALVDGEYALLERHLQRVADSARYFGFHFRERDTRAALSAARELHSAGEWRVRLLINRHGNSNVKVQPLEKIHEPLSVKLARSPIDDGDPLIYHKTSARSRYDAALSQCQPCDDVIFWNSRGEVTESTIANIVVEAGGNQWTPPRESGLLAGTLRAELIARGEVVERPITIEELRAADGFYLVNSVRGWMRATLTPTGQERGGS